MRLLSLPPLALAPVLALVLFFGATAQDAAPPAAEPEGPVEVAVQVKLKDGRTLEGVLVSESKDEIILRMSFGDIPVRRSEIAELLKEAPPAQGGGAGEEEGTAEPETIKVAIVTLKDGAVIRGRATERETEYEIETDLGMVRIPKRQVREIRYQTVTREAAAAPAPAEREEARDYDLGFVVRRPSEAWKFADQPPDPLARIVMRREEPLVIFRAALGEPLDPDRRDVEPAGLAAAQQRVKEELAGRFKAYRSLQIAIDRYRGVPVWRVSYQADTRVFGSKFAFREIRFPFGDASIVLQAYAPVAGAGASETAEVGAEMELALRSFGFIGPVDAADDRYANVPLGIRFERPRPGWQIAPRLLDAERPVEVLPPDGIGRYAVEVRPAGATASAQQAADALERELGAGSRFFKKLGRRDRSLSGVSAVELRYEDFGAGTKLETVHRLITVRAGKIVELVAAWPATEASGAKAAEIEAAVLTLFESFDSVIPDSPLAAYRRGARAIDLRIAAEKKLDESKGSPVAIDLLDQAIELAPNYGLAYLLRGKAWADSGEWKRALRDYDVADDLLDDPAIGRLVGAAQNQQAKAIAKDDFPEALRLFHAAIRNDPQNRGFKEDLIRAVLERARALVAAGKHEQAISDLREALARSPKETRFETELAKAHVDLARRAQQEGDLYKARNVCKRGLRLAPGDTALKNLLDRIEAEIKRKEEGAKKSGGKK